MAGVNRRLFDAIARHQVYLDGVAIGHRREFDAVIRRLTAEVQQRMIALKIDSFAGLSRAKQITLISDMRRINEAAFKKYIASTTDWLKKFTRVDYNLTSGLFGDITGRKIANDIAQRGANSRFAKYILQPMPANGATVPELLTAFQKTAQANLDRIIRRAVLEKWTQAQFLAEFVGRRELGYRNGLIVKLKNSANTITTTGLNHISAQLRDELGGNIFARYRWVSVIDKVTTDICRERNNRIYEYGDGPQPPAHYNCRSGTVPIDDRQAIDDPAPSFYAWIKRQPAAVQNDILTKRVADLLRSAKAKAADFEKANFDKPLTLEQFANKRSLMLTEE